MLVFVSAFQEGISYVNQYSVLTIDWTTGIQSLAEAKDISSSLCVQTSSEAHPASRVLEVLSSLGGVRDVRA
jgi:hypothetical protein